MIAEEVAMEQLRTPPVKKSEVDTNRTLLL